jgi:hypothetical protein
MRDVLAPLVTPDGIMVSSEAWLVRAVNATTPAALPR